jgi:hypothetical protein
MEQANRKIQAEAGVWLAAKCRKERENSVNGIF